MGKRLWIFDEHLAQHRSDKFAELSKHTNSLISVFFQKRLVVVLVDDKVRILQKTKRRTKEKGHTWEGHRNKNDKEILSVIENGLSARVKMYNELVKNGMNALCLNANDSVSLNVMKIAKAVSAY